MTGRRAADGGAASVWVLACCALLMLVGAVAAARASAVLARHRAESSADLAALAAAGRIGSGRDECAEARRVATANGARLRTCGLRLAADGRSGTVWVRITLAVRLPFVGAREVAAAAAAARQPASGTAATVATPAATARQPAASTDATLAFPAPDERRPSGGARPQRPGPWAVAPGGGRSGRAPPRPRCGMLAHKGQSGPDDDVGDSVEISVSQAATGDVPIVSVTGEVDVYSAPALKDKISELIRSGQTTLIVDLEGVGFLDSTGLGALVEARAATSEAGGTLPLVCNHERILKLFTITGLDGVFTIHPSIDDAVAALPG